MIEYFLESINTSMENQMAQNLERSLQHRDTNKPMSIMVNGVCPLATSYWFNTGDTPM